MFPVFLHVVLSFLSVLPLINAFTYSFVAPSECDDLALTWTGGTAPFYLNLLPVFGTPRNISIPSSAFNNGQGSYSFPLPFAAKTELVIAMSDATGFSTGGASNVLTVQPSKGGSCTTTPSSVDFSFQLNTALQQCRPYLFSGYGQAVQPVTIYVIIPGGNTITLNPPNGPTSFEWDVNVARSTSLMFMMVDANGRQGGSSDVKLVGVSDDSSCLDASSPTSTSNPPGASTSSTAPSQTRTTAATPSTSAAPSNGGISIAAIAGTVIGALLFLAVTITLGLFFLRRKKDAAAAAGGFNNHLGRPPPRTGYGFDSDYDHPLGPGGAYNGAPSSNSYPQSSSYPYTPNSNGSSGPNPFSDSYATLGQTGAPQSQSQYLPPSQTQQQPQYSPFDASSEYLSAPPGQYYSSQHPPPPSSLYQSNQSTQFDASSMYTSHYQESEVGQHTRRQPSGQMYPPTQYAPQTDPYNSSGPPMLPGTEFESFAINSRSETSPISRGTGPQSTAQRKASQGGSGMQRPTRFILHTDVEDDLPPANEDGVVELPPQYTERRGQSSSANPPPEKAGPPPGSYPL